MGFLDSLKDAAKAAKDTAKNAADQAKAKMDAAKEARAAEAAAREEAERKAREEAEANSKIKCDKILSGKDATKTGIFAINSMADTLAFTKEYMKKLVLPASSLKVSKLKMLPYTEDKVTRRDVLKRFADLPDSEQIIFLLDNNTTKEYLTVTTEFLYARIALEDNPQFFYNIKIPLAEITSIGFETEGETNKILCNGELLFCIPARLRETDFVNLKYYFECLEKSDFEITEQEIDKFIHEKIGDEAYNEAKKYMEEDELIIYFAWGVDSITAKDFLMCTTRQFVMLDREVFGVAQNVKKFYYEDIVSMSTEQANSDSLTVTLLNAALKLCDLTIFTAGTNLKIQTLSVTEAERVVEIYNLYKRLAREEAKKPIVVQRAEKAIDPLEQLEKLQKLKDAGIITEEEFATKKADLLAKL